MKTHKKVGLYVGKFVAYHKGHQYYINKFARSCDILHLVLCANTKTDMVPYEKRQDWLMNDMKEGLVTVRQKIKFHLSVEDAIPPYPDGIQEWCKWIENLVEDKIDIMFGNDDYVNECANIFGAYYYSPDGSRKNFNVSSTKIVKGGLKYYDYLTDSAKPYFNKEVLITGPESSGKTTLCKQLATFFEAPFVEEYGRSYEEETLRRFNLRCTQWGIEDYEKIARRQDEMIRDISAKPDRKLTFIDTDAIITEMFCELYLKKTSERLKDIILSQKFDLIIYLDPTGTKWVDDGLRFMEDQRSEVGELIKNKLTNLGRDFILVKNENGYQKRFEDIKQIIKAKFY